MLRKTLSPLAGLLLILLAAFFLRPVTLDVDGETSLVRGVFTVEQALAKAGIHTGPLDRVEPAPGRLVPLAGPVRVQRAVQLTVWEDGKTHQVSGLERSPAALLKSARIPLGENDRLLWNGAPVDPQAPLPAGQPIVLQLQHARAFIIDVNGERKRIDTSAITAAGALWDAGLPIGPGDALSLDPGTPLASIGAGPVVLAYRTAREVTILTGEKQVRARAVAETVGQALGEAGVSLQGLDYSEPAEDQPLPADGQVRVVRVREEITLKEELLPYESTRVPDPEGEIDQTRILQAGQYGVKVTRERAVLEDGQEVQRNFDSDWTASEPVAQTIGVGTKIVNKTLDAPGGQIEYWRAVQVYATSYSPCRLGTEEDICNYQTASGARLTKGIIAVTRDWYRQYRGMQVYVPGYGYGVIGDVGGGMPDRDWIDLGFDEENFEGIVGWVTMYFLTPAPE